uniref:CG11146 n=1 Tax=Macrostomum lignano TaxID=282301 RepID=A0A1I8IC88_9PLAT
RLFFPRPNNSGWPLSTFQSFQSPSKTSAKTSAGVGPAQLSHRGSCSVDNLQQLLMQKLQHQQQGRLLPLAATSKPVAGALGRRSFGQRSLRERRKPTDMFDSTPGSEGFPVNCLTIGGDGPSRPSHNAPPPAASTSSPSIVSSIEDADADNDSDSCGSGDYERAIVVAPPRHRQLQQQQQQQQQRQQQQQQQKQSLGHASAAPSGSSTTASVSQPLSQPATAASATAAGPSSASSTAKQSGGSRKNFLKGLF